jgi:hypothetical protein
MDNYKLTLDIEVFSEELSELIAKNIDDKDKVQDLLNIKNDIYTVLSESELDTLRQRVKQVAE